MRTSARIALKVRTWHRRLSIVFGIQFLLWTIGGLYFSWTEIDNIRGSREKRVASQQVLAVHEDKLISIYELSKNYSLSNIKSIQLKSLSEMVVYKVIDVKGSVSLYDALTGNKISPIDKNFAIKLAREDFSGEDKINRTTLINKANNEYRGKLPAWQVNFDNTKQTHIYVSADSGEIVARRNTMWRIFDFLWMLHILDFEDRSNINNWLLRLISVGGLITLASGYLLWYLGYRLKKR